MRLSGSAHSVSSRRTLGRVRLGRGGGRRCMRGCWALCGRGGLPSGSHRRGGRSRGRIRENGWRQCHRSGLEAPNAEGLRVPHGRHGSRGARPRALHALRILRKVRECNGGAICKARAVYWRCTSARRKWGWGHLPNRAWKAAYLARQRRRRRRGNHWGTGVGAREEPHPRIVLRVLVGLIHVHCSWIETVAAWHLPTQDRER